MRSFTRRKFVAASVSAVAATPFMSFASGPEPSSDKALTIGEVIELIKRAIPSEMSRGTVDTIKSGDPSQPVTGIISTMFPTVAIIREAIRSKSNLLIVHEPSFYTHADETGWLQRNEVFNMKKQLLEKNGIVIWRFHDYWHANQPDGVMMGVLTKLGWEKYYDPKLPRIITIPTQKLGDIITHAKKSLGIEMVRFIGKKDQPCTRIALLPGAWGGTNHINTINEYKPDLMMCGELQEWETSEYIRDAQAFGLNTSLIVLGHALSEEPGMEWLVPWLQPKVPGIPVKHIPSGNPFSFA